MAFQNTIVLARNNCIFKYYRDNIYFGDKLKLYYISDLCSLHGMKYCDIMLLEGWKRELSSFLENEIIQLIYFGSRVVGDTHHIDSLLWHEFIRLEEEYNERILPKRIREYSRINNQRVNRFNRFEILDIE